MLELSNKVENEEYQKLIFERRIIGNLKFLRLNVSRFNNLNNDEQELFSIGMVGLIKAAKTFDESKNIKFATYAGRCIRNEFLMYAKKNKKLKNEVSLNEPISVDVNGKEQTLEDILESGQDAFDKLYNDMLIGKALMVIQRLSPTKKEIIKKRILCRNPVSYKKLGEQFGRHCSSVSKMEKRSIKWLKAEFAEEIAAEYESFV